MSTRNVVCGMAALAITGLLAASAQAGVVAYEGFDYTAGTVLHPTANGGTGWASAWVLRDSAGLKVATSGLSYPGLPSSVGLALTPVVGEADQELRKMSSSVTGVSYISFLVQTRSNGASFLRVGPDGGEFASFGVKGTTLFANNSFTHDASDSLGTTGALAAGVTHLIVAKVDLLNGGLLSVYADPTAGAAEPASPAVTYAITAPISYDTIAVAGVWVGTTNVLFDEIRVGTTFADVTSVPEPTSIALLGAAAMGLIARRRRHA